MTTPAIVEGGCTKPGNLGSYGSRTRLMRQRLEAFEERMGRPTKIERYKLPDDEIVEFRFYRYEQPRRARTPSFWRSIFRAREAAPETGEPKLWIVAIRRKRGPLYVGGRSLYDRVIKQPGVLLISREPADRRNQTREEGA